MSDTINRIPNTITKRRRHPTIPEQKDNYYLEVPSLAVIDGELTISSNVFTVVDDAADEVALVEMGSRAAGSAVDLPSSGSYSVWYALDSRTVAVGSAPSGVTFQLGTVDVDAGTAEPVNTSPEFNTRSLSTDKISLNNPFVQKGDVIPYVSANGVAKNSLSTSSTGYIEDREFVAARFKWDSLFNPNQTLAAGLSIRVTQGTADIRIQNATQQESIVGGTDLDSGGDANYFLGFEDYEPPNRNSTDIVWVELASSDGGTTEIADGLLYIGPRV